MATLEYTVKDIGTNTFAGMLVRKTGDLTWMVDDVKDHEIVVNYTNCRVNAVQLAHEINYLYQRGALCVRLVEWEPAHERMFGDRLVTIPARVKRY